MNIKKWASLVFFIIFILLMLLSFISDFRNTIYYGGIDLRTRVVGTRVFLEGKDPYFFNWQPGMPDTLLDPLVEVNAKTSRLTVPPSVLPLHVPFAKWTYLQQKILWLSIQWVSFISIILIFLFKSKSINHAYLISILSLLFAHSFFWRFHVERSQLYIIYTCLFSISWLTYKTKSNLLKIISGLTLGFTICLRPPALLVLIPFICYRKLSMVAGVILGVLLGFTLPTLVSGLSIWKSYTASIKDITKYLSSHQIPAGNSLGNLMEGNTIYPKTIEGLNVIWQDNSIPAANTSLQKNLMNLGLENVHVIQNLILVLYILLLLIFFITNLKKKSNINLIFLQGIVAYLILEFLIPSPRYSYNDVQWLFPLLIIVNEAKEINFFLNRTTILLMTSLLLCIGVFLWVPKFMLISISLMTFYVIKTTFDLQKRINQRNI